MALLRQGRASGRLVVLVQALTTPTLVAAAAADSQPPGSFVQGTDVPAVIQVTFCACCLSSHVMLLALAWVSSQHTSIGAGGMTFSLCYIAGVDRLKAGMTVLIISMSAVNTERVLA